MRRIYRYLIAFFILIAPFQLFGKSMIELKGVDVSYGGAFDVFGAPIINLLEMEFLSYKPYLRYNVNSKTMKWGVMVEYFPLTQFELSFWIFNDNGINPYVTGGFEFPIDFSAFSTPWGLGFHVSVFSGFYVGFRYFVNIVLAPVVIDPSGSWDLTFELKW